MNGIVIIDKPAGKTSHDIVSEVKKILGAKKAGHTGTLDPMATGVLPVCLNEATKLAQFLSGESKEYAATMLLGVKTDTLDGEGKITAKSDKVVSNEEIRTALAKMVGKISQVPPAFSAVKYGGEPLYKYARRGVFPKMAAREVEISNIAIQKISFPLVTLMIACSKGTYIRQLCSDVGELLGCGACLISLRRLRSGFFSEDMAVSLDNYGYAEKKIELVEKMLSMTKSLPALAAIEVAKDLVNKLRTGYQPSVEMMKTHVPPFLEVGDMLKFISYSGNLVALAEMIIPANKFSEFDAKCQAARIIRVFNNIDN